MFKTEPMKKVRMICLEKQRAQVITAMHRLGMIDLRKSKAAVGDAGVDADQLNILNERLVRINGAMAVLSKRPPKKVSHQDLSRIIHSAAYTKALDEIYNDSDRLKQVAERKAELAEARRVAQSLIGIHIDLSKLESERLAIRGFEAEAEILGKVMDGFRKAGSGIRVAHSPVRNKMALVVVACEKGTNIEEVIKEHKLKEVELRSKYFKGSPEESVHTLDVLISGNAEEHAAAKARKEQLSDKHYAHLLAASEALQIEITRLNAALIFKKTDSTIIIEGWIPEKNVQEFKSTMQNETRGMMYLEEIDGHDELAPTLTKRPKFLRSYDYLVEFLSVPRSDELDPTWIFIITFPIFYGFMVSDVGYGILSMILATYIKRITDPEGLVYNASTLWQLNGAAAIVFGFITNQYFGLQFNQYFTTFSGIDWFKSIPTLMVIAVLFGVVQIVLGLAFGFYNKMHHHEKKLAISKLTSIVLIIAGTIAICGGLFGTFSYTVSLAAAILALLMLVATMVLAGQEAGEVPTLIAHILSYSRLMGFGLVSIIIAFLIDLAFTPTFGSGGIWGIITFILYLVIFLVLHVMNMIVSMFEAMVQAVRLNFVEFFTKFYQGGGVKFKPFSYKRVYTKE